MVVGRYHQPLLKVLDVGVSIPAGVGVLVSGVFDGVTMEIQLLVS